MPKSYREIETQYNKAIKDLAEAVVTMAKDETEVQMVSLDITLQEFLNEAFGEISDKAQEMIK